MRPFARFLAPAEWEDLVRGIILEHRLRKRIAQLQEYRRAGITSLAEAAEYEATKRRRAAEAALKRKSANYLFDNLGGESASAPHYRGGGAGGLSASGPGGRGSRSARAELQAPPKRKRGAGLEEGEGGGEGGEGAGAGSSASVMPSSSSSASFVLSPSAVSARPPASGFAGGEECAPFSITGMVGADTLCGEERAVCESLRLVPAEYGQIKAVLVNMALSRGFIRLNDVKSRLAHVEGGAVDGVYSFVLAAGLVSPRALVVPSAEGEGGGEGGGEEGGPRKRSKKAM